MPILAYFLKPDAGDEPSDSQSQIKTNFTSIQTLLDIDHVDFGSNDHGQHFQLTMPRNASLPDTTGYGNTLLFSVAQFTTGTNPTNLSELFFKRSSDGVNPGIPITAKDYPTIGNAAGDTGYTYLPSGVLINWGFSETLNFAAAGNKTTNNVVFRRPFAHATSYIVIPSIGATAAAGSVGCTVRWIPSNVASGAQCKFVVNAAGAGDVFVTYIAIGRG